MTRQASLFTAGPVLVKAATGEDVTTDELGGPQVAIASGVVHSVATDDEHAIDAARCWLSLLRR